MSELNNTGYKEWVAELKSRIRSVQVKAALAVNAALIEFYWDLGRMISEKQSAWGTKFIEQLAKDLKEEFQDMQGLSARNLHYIRQFYQFYQSEIVQQPVAQFHFELLKQIPWGHHILIFSKARDLVEAQFYIQQTLENNWSRNVLALQIKSQLYERQGKAITNFNATLPDPMSDLAQQALKDPYVFDFVAMSAAMQEKDLEKQLVSHITRFLLELGKGFAFIGQQYHLEIAGNDYYLDLLFYHIRLKCYVVIELKNTKFIPEYAGKMNFYLSAVDTLLKQADDKPSIGILLCRDKNNIEVEFALRDLNKPIGVSEFTITEVLPEELKHSLPTVEELEQELENLNTSDNEK
jgi:predicted nuclease of restriction endonuclease-like (RecB) superfamily